MCLLVDRAGLLTLLFSPGDQVRWGRMCIQSPSQMHHQSSGHLTQ